MYKVKGVILKNFRQASCQEYKKIIIIIFYYYVLCIGKSR